MIRIYDDIVSKDLQDSVEKIVFDQFFPWYFVEDVTYKNVKEIEKKIGKEGAYPGFFHYFFMENKVTNSDFETIKKLLFCVKDFSFDSYVVFSCRTFLQLPLKHINSNYTHNHKHTDISSNIDAISALYYVNETDGDTVFFGKNPEDNLTLRVSPKKGRLVLFDSDIYHASTDPSENYRRAIINFILVRKNNDNL
jgi:hypothetical protein